MRFCFFLFLLIVYYNVNAQQNLVTGKLINAVDNKPIENATVIVVGTTKKAYSNQNGTFTIANIPRGNHQLEIAHVRYYSVIIPIKIPIKEEVSVGTIMLEPDVNAYQLENTIALTESEINDDEAVLESSFGFLQSTKDIFLQRAAFDFGQTFFKVRGYDSREGILLINGIELNKQINGRPQWNNWGGLNDVTRNQEFSSTLKTNNYSFGGLLGTTNISTQPEAYRQGIRLSASYSNRTYSNRFMATYSSGLKKKMAYTLSASKRWARQGYVDGTLYDAHSLFGSWQYNISSHSKLHLTGIWAYNKRGRSAPITEEVFNLSGRDYNPYWGYQDNKIRNARERVINEPIFILNYYLQNPKFKLNTGIAYQTGFIKNSRLGYYNAPNPDPVYYRYLPSYYISSNFGANFNNVSLSEETFLQNSQIDWDFLYQVNNSNATPEKASYLLYNDVNKSQTVSANTTVNFLLNQQLKIDAGIQYINTTTKNYAEITDLLGASFHEDVDAFTNTQNNTVEPITKYEGDTFNYNYLLQMAKASAFVQTSYTSKKITAFITGGITQNSVQREGLYLNERYPTNSLGKSENITFLNNKIKSGVMFSVSPKHRISLNTALITRAPLPENMFVNVRESNQTITPLNSEKIWTSEANYFFKNKVISARLSAYITEFTNSTDLSFYYVDTAQGSDFVQEVLTNSNKQHLGAELGLQLEASSTVLLTAVAAYGNFTYTNNPNLTLYFDTADVNGLSPNGDGSLDFGEAKLKGYKLSNGPQQAYSFGITYRDPDYWWVTATTNYLSERYIGVSNIARTSSFVTNPDTGQPYPEATEQALNKLLEQKPLEPVYLLNVVGGKSWKYNNTYISVFASINNLFDDTFKTGGFEQSRNGNFVQMQQDLVTKNPRFGPKYWYGYGRTFFINMAVSF